MPRTAWIALLVACGCGRVAYDPVDAGGARISVKPGWTISSAGDANNPSLLWTGSELAIGWHDTRDGDQEIFFRIFALDGTPLGPELQLTNDAGRSRDAHVAWNGSVFAVAYRVENEAPGILSGFVSILGSAGPISVQLTTGRHVEKLRIIAYGAQFLLAYEDPATETVELVVVDAAGSVLGPPVFAPTPGSSLHPELASSGDEVVLAWRANSPGEIVLAPLTVESGVPRVGTPLVRNYGESSVAYPVLASVAGAGWAVGYTIGPDETRRMRVSLPNAPGPLELWSGDEGRSVFPGIAAGAGTLGVVWIEAIVDYGVLWFALVEGDTGTRVTKARMTEEGQIADAAAIVWADGEYVVAWEDKGIPEPVPDVIQIRRIGVEP